MRRRARRTHLPLILAFCVTTWVACATAQRDEPAPPETKPKTLRPSRLPFVASRLDYASFRTESLERGDSVFEPNYLPFMTHRFEMEGTAEDWILFCRWPESRLPLSIYIDTPEIAADLRDQGEFHQPKSYVEAAEAAVAAWEAALPETLHFERVDQPERADLRLRLLGARGPKRGGEAQVLGSTPILKACRVTGGDPARGQVEVEFEVPWVEVFIADRYGLLEPNQVRRVALHEIGHALGMRGHSPIPAHLMFGETQGRPVDELSPADVNSFRALYAIPNGTIYTRVRRGGHAPASAPMRAAAAPTLEEEAVVDRALGFALRVPEGWQVVREPQGLVAIDGVVWDYEASFSVTARGYQSVEGYLDEYRQYHVGRGVVQGQRTIQVAGREAQSMRVYQPRARLLQEQVFLATGDGRVLILVAEAPAPVMRAFAPSFDAILQSFEVRPAAPRQG